MASIKKYKTAKGTAWRVQYRSPDGKSRTKQGFDTKAHAEAWAAKNTVSINSGQWVDAARTRTTVGAVWPAWIASQTHLAPSSHKALTTSWRVHVEPRFGHVPLAALTPSDIQAWVVELSSRRSASIVQRAFHLLRSLVHTALRDRVILHDPTTGVRLPTKRPSKMVTLTAQQVLALADASKRYSSLILFLGFTGARWGEATALTVGDIDFARGRALISKSVSGDTKTGVSRSIAVPAHVLAAMKPDVKDKLPGALVWSRDGVRPVPTPSRRSWWHSAVDRCREADGTFPDVTPHDLRHAAASIMISAGASVMVVQRQLGHAGAKMTLDRYAHLFDHDLDQVSAAVGNAVGATPGQVVKYPR